MANTHLGGMKIAAKFAGLSLEEFQARIDAGMKKCSQCKQWFPVENFAKDAARFDGLNNVGKCCRHVKIRKPTKGRISNFKGKKHTAETRKMISDAVQKAMARGVKMGWPKGKPIPPETREKISATVLKHAVRGRRHYAWKNGAAARNLDGRRDWKYRWWRDAVFRRDSFTCQKCGYSKGHILRAHHIKPFSKFPELRYDVANGVTLCHTCHELAHFKPDSIRNIRKLKRGQRLWQ